MSKGDFEQLESLGLLEDNQQMAKLLADSEGDKKEVANLLERLSEERKNFQRKMKQFKEQGLRTHTHTRMAIIMILYRNWSSSSNCGS